jgi:DNA-binding transcriptional ArsR family regulator
MKETSTIKNLEQIKVLAHPLRMRLLEAFSHTPVTTKQVAQQLGEQPTKLYHHVNALERVGLIKLVKTLKKRGTTEKYYQTIADHFIVDRNLFGVSPRSRAAMNRVQVMTTQILENAVSEIRQSLAERLDDPQREKGQFILSNTHIRATPDQIVELNKKINRLIKETGKMKRKKGSAKYGVTLALYKTGRKDKKKKER